MKNRYIYFIILKLIFVVQCALVLTKKQSSDSSYYFFTDTIFKLSLALYLYIFIWLYDYHNISWEDKLIISFSAALIVYDIDYTNLVKYLRKAGIPDNYLFRYMDSLETTKVVNANK